MEGTNAQVRSGGAKQQYVCGMETVYIKQEVEDEVTTAEPIADTEKTRESRSVIYSLIMNAFIAMNLVLLLCHAWK